MQPLSSFQQTKNSTVIPLTNKNNTILSGHTSSQSQLIRTQPTIQSGSELDPAYAYYLDVSVPKPHCRVARVKSSTTASSMHTKTQATKTLTDISPPFSTRRGSIQSAKLYTSDSSRVPAHYNRVGPGSYINDITFGTHTNISKYQNNPYYMMHRSSASQAGAVPPSTTVKSKFDPTARKNSDTISTAKVAQSTKSTGQRKLSMQAQTRFAEEKIRIEHSVAYRALKIEKHITQGEFAQADRPDPFKPKDGSFDVVQHVANQNVECFEKKNGMILKKQRDLSEPSKHLCAMPGPGHYSQWHPTGMNSKNRGVLQRPLTGQVTHNATNSILAKQRRAFHQYPEFYREPERAMIGQETPGATHYTLKAHNTANGPDHVGWTCSKQPRLMHEKVRKGPSATSYVPSYQLVKHRYVPQKMAKGPRNIDVCRFGDKNNKLVIKGAF